MTTWTSVFADTYTYTWQPSAQGTAVAKNLSAGAYTVLVFDSGNNCTASKTVQVVAPDCTGLVDLKNENQSFKIYPNPAKTELNIECQQSSQFTIFDQLGKIVCEKALPGGTSILSLIHLSSGIYFVYFKDSYGTKTLKLAKAD